MKLLALDTSTDTMSIAVSRDGVDAFFLQHTATGGAQASLALIPAVMQLLQQGDMALASLDAVCFGNGPGSFTGLRTACSVAQGLAFGAGVPVLPLNSLLAVAEDARFQMSHPQVAPGHAAADMVAGAPVQITALLDARMDELYVASFVWDGRSWTTVLDSGLVKPEALVSPSMSTELASRFGVIPHVLAGNAFALYGNRLTGLPGELTRIDALPTAAALLRLAPACLAAGLALPPEQALPLYIRDKVAQTTAERAAIKAEKERMA